jgi:hypothetical protein
MKLTDYLKKPVIAGVIGGVIGLIIGLIWAWMIQPVVWTNVPPTAYQDDYLRMAIDSYSKQPDNALALQRYQALGTAGPVALASVKNSPGTLDVNAISAFSTAVQPAESVTTPAVPTPQPSGNTRSVTAIAVIIGAVLLFALVGYGILKYLIPLFRNPQGAETAEVSRMGEISGEPGMTDYQAMGQEPPISQFVTTYNLGDDLFDDSFSIDSPSGEFLGECGIGISETIGVGDPKKVQAFEVWLFDKNDVQTVTKVLMSAHAYNDVATFQRMQAKGEPFMVERGKQIVLETAALQLLATVSDAAYGQGALPEQSYFDRLTLEISVWPKTGQPVQQ